jgi:membrane fusion protein, multidrug efflux system
MKPANCADMRSKTSALRKAVAWIAAVAAVLAASVSLVLARDCQLRNQRDAFTNSLAQGPRVLVTQTRQGATWREVELPASIVGYVQTPIYARIAGNLKTIRVDKGDRVRKGQVLAILESPETDKQVADARASYWLQKVIDDRNQQLLRSKAIAQQAADNSHAMMLQARASYQYYVALQSYEAIKAPLDGEITARYVNPGALIPQTTSPTNSTPILAMETLQPLRVYADAPQELASSLKDGDPARVTVPQFPRRVFEGTITRHPEALNPDTRTMVVEVDLPNSDLALFPGMYATMDLRASTPWGAPRVPDDALVFRDGETYVPLVEANHIRLAEVTLGPDNGHDVEITNGVEGGALVALNLGQAVRNGEAVQPVRLNDMHGTPSGTQSKGAER